jgi:hypothetical protein
MSKQRVKELLWTCLVALQRVPLMIQQKLPSPEPVAT